jgi:hypothetical protein
MKKNKKIGQLHRGVAGGVSCVAFLSDELKMERACHGICMTAVTTVYKAVLR